MAHIKNKPEYTTGTDEQNKEAFEDWFYKLLFDSEHLGSCSLRTVVRKNKKHLFETWLEVKPYRFIKKGE